jgi:hypothetical protein
MTDDPRPARLYRRVSLILVSAIVWVALTGGSLVLFFVVGPRVDPWILGPILVEQNISEVRRIGASVCWRWTWLKRRDARPTDFVWSFRLGSIASGPNVSAAPAVVVRQRTGEQISRPPERVSGRGETRLCATIPDDLRIAENLVLDGAGRYDTGVWDVWQSVPAFAVPRSEDQ